MAAMMGYPYNSPRLYDEFGRIKQGKVTWDPDPNEGPYRPFFVTNKVHGRKSARAGQPVIVFIEACTDDEFKKEVDSMSSALCCMFFCCCFVFGFTGTRELQKAESYLHSGRNKEARDTLLDAKVKWNKGFMWGSMLCACCFGIPQLVLLPFIWVVFIFLKLTRPSP